MPATFLGLTNVEKNESIKIIYNVMNSFVQPLFRFEFAMGRIIYTLLAPAAHVFLTLSVIFVFVCVFGYFSKGWLNAVILASWKKDD
jgi:hypothetical protein